MRCRRCDVEWEGRHGPACWYCGQTGQHVPTEPNTTLWKAGAYYHAAGNGARKVPL